MKPEELIRRIEQKLLSLDAEPTLRNEGRVESIGDGIVQASGLTRAGVGEVVEFEGNGSGLILTLDEDLVSIILLSSEGGVDEGMRVTSTGRLLEVSVNDDLLGRVVDPLGKPLDGRPLNVSGGAGYPLERTAPRVTERRPVWSPLKTGIKAIDAVIPIGRGQRELIIGDRGTGKTSLALDAIINQKRKDLDLPQVICIYCAIGQKRGNIARAAAVLAETGAMEYTIVVSASAADPASLLYIAPFTATAIGEYFMDRGRDVLVVYDDLSKHAWAYRQLSLLLRRPAGREAYPGDIFYLHSRLLERAASLSDARGGGSLTALPIIETQANDIAAYIPTNVISITDGQIYLETDLFNAGVKPAINVGLSVSRVGSAAQTKAMKQVAAPMRLELAQYRELAVFTQFGGDLDGETLKRIERGKRVSEILNQPKHRPMEEAAQITSLFAAMSGALGALPVDKIRKFEEGIMDYVRLKDSATLGQLSSGEPMDEETRNRLKGIIEEYARTIL